MWLTLSSSSESSANRTSSNLLRKNARVDSRAGAAAKLEVGGAPAQPDRIVDLAHLLLPRHGRFQALDRSALRPQSYRTSQFGRRRLLRGKRQYQAERLRLRQFAGRVGTCRSGRKDPGPDDE